MDVLHAALDVTDLETTVRFYEDLLGLERTREAEIDGQQHCFVGGSGPAELQFVEVEARGDPTGINHVAVATDDLDGVLEAAQAEWDSTVEVEPQTVGGEVRIAFVTDPAGYSVELIEQRE